jgi:hypothetical protein
LIHTETGKNRRGKKKMQLHGVLGLKTCLKLN